MKLEYIIIRPKQKYSPNSGLQRGSRLLKKQKPAGKVMATVFWDSHRVILIDYLKKIKTITGAYYASLLDKLKAELNSAVGMAKIHELRFELLDHPSYSPDLAPSDFFLFPHLKIALGGQRFSSNKEAITFVNNYFAKKNAEYYLDGLQKWEHRGEKCVE